MAIRIRAECIRNQYQWSNCHHCLSACPIQAIKINSQISIDTNQCNQCGRCVDACPFDAITGDKPIYKIKENTLYEDNQLSPSLETLLLLKAEGIHDIKLCANNSTWINSINQANQILDDNHISGFKIKFFEEHAEKISYSRRSFLRLLQLNQSIKSSNKENATLLTAYPNYQFHRITLEPTKCNLCTSCEKFCPENCIQIEADKITINGKNCHGCQLCADICQKKSLLIKKEMHQIQINTYPVYQRQCVECNKNYQRLNHPKNTLQRCPACEFRQQNKTPMYKIGQNAM
ncbi:4Fe-4S binding protein [Dickeya dianthicola]|uniref:4Fe-4S binding protein n=1 Tax=Dickeya dianthicola TaxID=204039 RepID=UPI0018666B6D|nr:4Fe-4S binding protein [Dickeya dianthicola]QOL13428.1 4Fe-4S binding protein [Dickeya dianthicola]